MDQFGRDLELHLDGGGARLMLHEGTAGALPQQLAVLGMFHIRS
jgi:hypothetical protein